VQENLWKHSFKSKGYFQANYIEEALRQAIKPILGDCGKSLAILTQNFDDESAA